MEQYIAQKAQQALEALCSDAPLRDRLKSARGHFCLVAGAHFLKTAPPEVGESITDFMDADIESDAGGAARELRTAIECVFESIGRESIPHDVRCN